MQNEAKTLCGVCAALMTEAGIRLRKVPGRTEKVTCEHCGRRRFGGAYELDTSSGAGAPPSPQGEGNKRRNQNG